MKHLILKTLMVLVAFVFSFSIASAASDVQLKDYNTVPTLTQGQSYSIHGLIESKNKMNRVEIGVVDPKVNKWVIRYDKKINTDNFSILKADSTIKFGTLKVGTYKYRIYAHSNGKVYTLLNQQFVIKPKPQPTIKTVSEQQTFLNNVNQGSIIGALAVDGKAGPATIASIKIFQQIEGLEVDGKWGQKTETASRKTITVNGARKSMNWACSVANDNSFAYGVGKRAHRSGCYYCKTNTGNVAWNKERSGEPHTVDGHTYTKTYCCNTFITSAYAHGAKDPKILSICKKCNCCGMSPSDWTKSPNFKNIGKAKNIPYSKLRAGDVIMINTDSTQHVWMYLGYGRLVESAYEGWGAGTISVSGGAQNRYNKYAKANPCYVVRYSK